MKLDLHVKTMPLSRVSLQGVEPALVAARECGLDGIVLTETNVVRNHNAYLWAADLARKRYGLTVLQGLYLHTTLGPLLVYGQSLMDAGPTGIRIDHRPDTEAAILYCLDRGWAVVVAAPFRYGVGADEGLCHRFLATPTPVETAALELGYLIRRCHAVEISGCASKRDNDLALGLAERFSLPAVAGSGACYPTQVKAGCYTKVPNSVTTNERLAVALAQAAQSQKGIQNDLVRTPDLRDFYKSGRGRIPAGPRGDAGGDPGVGALAAVRP